MKSSDADAVEFSVGIYDERDGVVLLCAPLIAAHIALIIFSGSLLLAAMFVPIYAGFQSLLRCPPKYVTAWNMLVMVEVMELASEHKRT